MEKFTFKGMNLPVKAQVVGEHLMGIYNKNDKQLTAKLVIKDAIKKKSPIHSCFNWDVKKAAYEHWLHEARNMIKNLVIIRTIEDKEVPMRIFVNIQRDKNDNLTHNLYSKGRSYYMNIDDVMIDVELQSYTLEQALRELTIFRNKYKNLKEFANLFEFIEADNLIPA